jgi:hypothetical protein
MLCSKCFLEKEESLFKRDKERKSGFSSWCKACNVSYSSKNQAKNHEKISKYKKIYKNNRLKSDGLFKLRNYISCVINSALKYGGYSKRSKTQNMLCCSYTFTHLSFTPMINKRVTHTYIGFPDRIPDFNPECNARTDNHGYSHGTRYNSGWRSSSSTNVYSSSSLPPISSVTFRSSDTFYDM